jgi:hypothetical protein
MTLPRLYPDTHSFPIGQMKVVPTTANPTPEEVAIADRYTDRLRELGFQLDDMMKGKVT